MTKPPLPSKRVEISNNKGVPHSAKADEVKSPLPSQKNSNEPLTKPPLPSKRVEISNNKGVSHSAKIDSKNNTIKTDQNLSIDCYPELTKAKEEICIWCYNKNTKYGDEEYHLLMAKISDLSKNFPKKKIILYADYFRFGFNLFYAKKLEEEKYIPIKPYEGYLLNRQVSNKSNVFLPLKDPQDNNYFVPEITVEEVRGSHTGSETTASYLCNLIKFSSLNEKNHRILEGLIGYAKDIQREVGNLTYTQLRQIIPSYPNLPDLAE